MVSKIVIPIILQVLTKYYLNFGTFLWVFVVHYRESNEMRIHHITIFLFYSPVICTLLINVSQNRRDNQEWTIQRHWQHWAHKTRDEDKQINSKKKNHNTESLKDEQLHLLLIIYTDRKTELSTCNKYLIEV